MYHMYKNPFLSCNISRFSSVGVRRVYWSHGSRCRSANKLGRLGRICWSRSDESTLSFNRHSRLSVSTSPYAMYKMVGVDIKAGCAHCCNLNFNKQRCQLLLPDWHVLLSDARVIWLISPLIVTWCREAVCCLPRPGPKPVTHLMAMPPPPPPTLPFYDHPLLIPSHGFA